MPGLPDERQRPRGHRHARDRDALVGALPPDRSGHRRAVAGRDHHHRHDAAGDDPRRHRGRGPPGRPALHGTRRASGAHPVRGARRPDHRRRRRRSRVRDRRGQDHPGPRPRRPRDRPASRSPGTDHPGRRCDCHRDRDALRRDGPVRGAGGDRRRPGCGRRPRGDGAARDGHRALPAQQRHHRAAAQDPVVHPRRRRSRNGRSRRPAADGRGSSPSDSRRPGSTG